PPRLPSGRGVGPGPAHLPRSAHPLHHRPARRLARGAAALLRPRQRRRHPDPPGAGALMSGRLAAMRPGLARLRPRGAGGPLTLGLGTCFLSLMVLIPLAAVVWRSQSDGADTFWAAVSSPRAVSALELTVGISLVVAVINAVMGTLIAWVIVRDRFPGRRLVDALIDMPFALPTIVAGLTMIALYGPRGP